jgi:hypothetical protein
MAGKDSKSTTEHELIDPEVATIVNERQEVESFVPIKKLILMK